MRKVLILVLILFSLSMVNGQSRLVNFEKNDFFKKYKYLIDDSFIKAGFRARDSKSSNNYLIFPIRRLEYLIDTKSGDSILRFNNPEELLIVGDLKSDNIPMYSYDISDSSLRALLSSRRFLYQEYIKEFKKCLSELSFAYFFKYENFYQNKALIVTASNRVLLYDEFVDISHLPWFIDRAYVSYNNYRSMLQKEKRSKSIARLNGTYNTERIKDTSIIYHIR